MPVPAAHNFSQRLRAGLAGRSWTFWLSCIGLAALFLLLRWNNFNAPLIRDEGEYAYSAQILKQGIAPYDHAFIQKPPMVIYSYFLADWLMPDIFWSPRLLACGFVALATLLLGCIARLEFGEGFAWPVMWLVTPMILLPGIGQFTANTEMFMLLPLTGTFAVYCYSRKNGLHPQHWFWAGLMGATTLLYKYTALPVLGFMFLAWLVETWRTTRDARFLIRCCAALVLGGIIATVSELGFFLAHDGGATLWDCTVRFNRDYVASNNFSFLAMWQRLKALGADWWFLCLPGLGVFCQMTRRLWFWVATLACAVVSTGASSFEHYYIVLMPFGALLAAVGVNNLSMILSKRAPAAAVKIKNGILFLAVFMLFLPDAPWLSLSPEAFAAAKLSRRSVFIESLAVGRRVAELSSPQDFVWVAASEPQILCYAKRQSPTRFITVYALTIPNAKLDDYQAQAIREVQAHPPELIVWAQSWLQETPQPSPCLIFLNQTLAQDYERVGGYVLAGKDSRWVEPLPDEELPAASVVLFKRKHSTQPAPGS
ncbi:MAG TPA: hypothetical protein VIK53_11770 [Verrucomicrobiae bacterium]